MHQLWFAEFKRFSNLSSERKVCWFAKLVVNITMLGRGCYVPGGDSLKDPVKMRRFNEITHRISTQLLRAAEKDCTGMPDDVFFEMISEEFEVLGVNREQLIEWLR